MAVAALTTKETKQLRESYYFLYRSLKELHSKIENYEEIYYEGKDDVYLLIEMLHHFRHSIIFILREYINTYPECEKDDESGKKNNKDTIIYLYSNDIITKETKDLFIQMNRYGNIDAHPDERLISLEEFPNIKKAYGGLLNYLHYFIIKFCQDEQ